MARTKETTTIKGFAEMAEVSVVTVRRWRERTENPLPSSIGYGGIVEIPVVDGLAWLRKHRPDARGGRPRSDGRPASSGNNNTRVDWRKVRDLHTARAAVIAAREGVSRQAVYAARVKHPQKGGVA